MRATAWLAGRLVCCLMSGVKGFLPDLDQGRIALAGLNPEPEHVKAARCFRVVQEAFLAAMAQPASKAVTTDQ